MAIIQGIIIVRQGKENELDTSKLLPGEFAFATDTHRLFVGTSSGAKEIAFQGEVSGSVTDEQIQEAVNKYLEENPIDPGNVTGESIKEALGYTPADEAQIPKNTSDLNNDSGFLTKAVSDLANYYLKTETFTRDEINAKLSAIPKFSIQVVTSLPTANISETTVYLLKVNDAAGNLYEEYIYVDSAWEKLGIQNVNLTGYAKSGHGIYYGTCDTDKNEVEKVVTLADSTGFNLTVGSVVIVKFANNNSASNPKLNVSGSGAIPIMRYGTTAVSTASTTSGWEAGAVQVFVYDGTNWVRDYWYNTTYSNPSLGQGYAKCQTAASALNKTAQLNSYELKIGGIVVVNFENSVPGNSTLNVNQKGAKNIYYRGALITSGVIEAGDDAAFVYDGSGYQLFAVNKNFNNYAKKATTLAGYGITDGATKEQVTELSEQKVDKEESVMCIPQTLTEAQKAQARANIGATAGEDVAFADSIEWLNENGDTTKKYVLPDGYIYTYSQKTVTVTHNANDGTGFINVRPTASSGSDKDANTTKNGLFTTAPIAVDNSWSDCVANISGLEKLVPTFYASLYVYFFDANGTFLFYRANNQVVSAGTTTTLTSTAEVELPLPVSIDLTYDKVNSGKKDLLSSNNVGYIRIAVGIKLSAAITDSDIDGLVINVDRLNTEETVYGWYSTGQQHSNDKATQQNSADIATLKEEVEILKEAVKTTPSQSGAVWYAIGDSITYGLYSTSFENYYQPIIGQRWVDYVAQYNGYKLTNLGISGSGFVTGTTFRAVVDGNDFSNVNLVTIMLGINDWKNTEAVDKVGTMDDDIATGGTIVSELRYGLEKIISQNPYCKIILITPINAKIGSRGTEDTNWAYGYSGTITPCGSLKNFGDKLKEVCEYYGIQVVDMTNSSVVNRKSITTVLPDGIHPNLECYEVLGKELARRITFA